MGRYEIASSTAIDYIAFQPKSANATQAIGENWETKGFVDTPSQPPPRADLVRETTRIFNAISRRSMDYRDMQRTTGKTVPSEIEAAISVDDPRNASYFGVIAREQALKDLGASDLAKIEQYADMYAVRMNDGDVIRDLETNEVYQFNRTPLGKAQAEYVGVYQKRGSDEIMITRRATAAMEKAHYATVSPETNRQQSRTPQKQEIRQGMTLGGIQI